MDELLIDFALTLLLRVIKNPDKVKKFKKALRKLRDALAALPLD